ncbi:MAG: DNA methyltransferase, partial [Bacteroidales bacterium]|nr:DNA methyltransferase [Bacteroidales bacterium]
MINLSDNNDWDSLISIANKDVKLGRSTDAIFKLFSLGVVTNRDEWVYDDSRTNLEKKVNFLIDVYNKDADKHKGKSKADITDGIDYSIKWTRAVKNDLEKGKYYSFDSNLIIESLYRPFVKKYLYFSKELNEMQYQNPSIYGINAQLENQVINFNTNGTDIRFHASKTISDLHFLGDNQCLPLYQFNKEGNRNENITDWGLQQFVDHYQDTTISKENIFHYT